MAITVSVIMPVFNDQCGLSRCLEALNRQQEISFNEFEVLVIDNGSLPPLELPGGTSMSVRLLHCSKAGSYAARNIGVVASQGAVLAFIDADCRPSPKWLYEGLDMLDSQSRDIIGGEVVFELSVTPNFVELYQNIIGFSQENNIKERMFSKTANLFVRKEAFFRVGYFKEELLSCGDAEWCWRAQDCGLKIGYSARAIASTKPRRDLKSAITQMRRIAGGRDTLKKLHPHRVDRHTGNAFQHNKSVLTRVKTIWEANNLSPIDRLGVLFAAAIIRLAYLHEALWVTMGKKPERR